MQKESFASRKKVLLFLKFYVLHYGIPPRIDMKPEEKILVAACQNGETARFAELYDLYADRIFRFIYHKTMQRELAEDLVSDTFLKAIEKIGQFNAEKGQFSTWIYTIARNLITDHWRVHREHKDIEDVWDLASLDDVADAVSKNIVGQKLHDSLRELSAKEREILMRRYWQDLKFSEIAELTGKSEGAVKMMTARAIQKLKADIGGVYGS